MKRPSKTARRSAQFLLIGLGLLLLAGCGRNMFDQQKFEVYESTDFFANDSSARPLPEGTVSRERGDLSPAFLTGSDANGPLTELPIPLTRATIERGQDRFNIYCAPCHNYTGDGMGMIVQKGFPQPPSLLSPRLEQAPVGHFYNVITNGFGRMYSYAARVTPEDRWAITAYIRALQLSQNARLEDVPAEFRAQLESSEQVKQ